jgi:hypothetical protein
MINTICSNLLTKKHTAMKRKNFSKLSLSKVTVTNLTTRIKGGGPQTNEATLCRIQSCIQCPTDPVPTQLNTCAYSCYCTVGVSCGCDTYFCQSLQNACETITDGNMCNY